MVDSNLPLVGGDPTRDAGEITASAVCVVGGIALGVILIVAHYLLLAW